MPDKVLTKIEIQPGINKNDTEYKAENYWVSGDKVRFRFNNAEKLGGWRTLNLNRNIEGVTRAFHSWTDLDGQAFLAAGTHNHLYLVTGNSLSDITPVQGVFTLASSFITTADSRTIEVSTNLFQPITGDFVNFTSETSASGSNINGEYQVTSTGSGTFEFTASTSATGSVVDDGKSTNVELLLEAGAAQIGAYGGYSSSTYGSGPYGQSPYEVRTDITIRLWSLDNYGEDLIAAPRGGKIYRWDRTSTISVRASVMSSNAPVKNNVVIVAQPLPYVVSYGCSAPNNGPFDPLRIRWSDIDDINQWEASSGNSAGDYRIAAGSEIVGVQKTKKEIIVFTDKSAFTQEFTGDTDVFSFELLGTNCGLVGQNAAIDVNGTVYWMSYGSFYRYDGTIRPLRSTLDKAIFEQDSSCAVDYDNKDKIYCGINSEFYEIWWFYPCLGSVNGDNDRYVIFNYQEGTWYDGSLNRTAWIDSDIFSRPIGIETSGGIYQHELGSNDGNSILYSFVKSGQIDIEDGDELMYIDKFVPDFRQTGPLDITFQSYKYPYDTPRTKGPYSFLPTTKQRRVRARGRALNMQIESSSLNGDYQVGALRFNIVPDGER